MAGLELRKQTVDIHGHRYDWSLDVNETIHICKKTFHFLTHLPLSTTSILTGKRYGIYRSSRWLFKYLNEKVLKTTAEIDDLLLRLSVNLSKDLLITRLKTWSSPACSARYFFREVTVHNYYFMFANGFILMLFFKLLPFFILIWMFAFYCYESACSKRFLYCSLNRKICKMK